MRNLFFAFLIMIAVLGFSSGCSLFDAFFMDSPQSTAQELFEEGNDAMLAKDYVSASKYFSDLKETYPFSPYTIEAELSLADCYYLDSEWVQASEAYKEFEAMHPRHQAIPYVLYYIGMSNLQQYTSIDRPPTVVREAYSYFFRLRESFPGDEYAIKAAEKMQECRYLMAKYEIYLGDFYFRTENYGASWIRYKAVVDNFADVEEFYKYASEKIHAAYLLNSQRKAEEVRRTREGSWKDFFDWL